jgi:hypothetical protein
MDRCSGTFAAGIGRCTAVSLSTRPRIQRMIVLGWREWLTLPELGVARLRAKIDTGARSSALHVDAQWRFHEAGVACIGFRLTLGRGENSYQVEARAPISDERDVVDSGGHRCRRVFVSTLLRVAGAERRVEMNLADRRGMRFPMLLGRTALAGMFTVDPSCSYIHARPPRFLEPHE